MENIEIERILNQVKWHWILLLIGLGMYVLALVPGLLPHTVDITVAMLAGMTILSVAIFGFDSTQVDKKFANLMVIISLIMFAVGIKLAWDGHVDIFFVLSVPAMGLGLLGARKRGKNT